MRCKTDTPSVEASRDERVARISSFIAERLGSQADGPAAGICLIARSLQSPVAKAVAMTTAESGVTVPVKALLASVDRKALDGLGTSWEIRVVRTPRLLDAHEQLTVGDGSWHGDALRRDPDRRDAFEQFHGQAGEAQAWAETSFQRLWAMAEPVVVIRPTMPRPPEADAELAAIAGDCKAVKDPQPGEGLQG